MTSVSRIALALSMLAGGCMPFGAPHTTMHPTEVAGTSAAGVSVGGLYSSTHVESDAGSGSDQNAISLPYGEGWARFGMGQGQLEVRASSNAGSLGYRIDLTSDEGLTLALQPSVGAGFWTTSTKTEAPGDDGSSLTAFTLAPTMSFLVVVGGGSFYLGPRVAYQLLSQTLDPGDEDESSVSSHSFAFGSVLGTIIRGDPFDISLEAGGYGHFGSAESENDGSVTQESDTSGFLFVASVGLQLSTDPSAHE